MLAGCRILRSRSITAIKAVGSVTGSKSLANYPQFRNVHEQSTRSKIVAMASEVDAAKANAPLADAAAPTIFDKIINKQIPATIIYEDDECLAFRDISPQAPVHFLVIPKQHNGLTRLSKATEAHKAQLGHLLYVAQLVAKQENLEPGFRVVINDGPQGCQSVYHMHLHVMGGRQLGWPPC